MEGVAAAEAAEAAAVEAAEAAAVEAAEAAAVEAAGAAAEAAPKRARARRALSTSPSHRSPSSPPSLRTCR